MHWNRLRFRGCSLFWNTKFHLAPLCGSPLEHRHWTGPRAKNIQVHYAWTIFGVWNYVLCLNKLVRKCQYSRHSSVRVASWMPALGTKKLGISHVAWSKIICYRQWTFLQRTQIPRSFQCPHIYKMWQLNLFPKIWSV